MKIRMDFVTNSSSSCYVIKLCISTTKNENLEYEGWIDESSGGYISDEGTPDPRILAEADSVESLKQMLRAFSTLSENNYEVKNDEGEMLDYWSPSDIPGCPDDDDEFDEWYEDLVYSEGTGEYVFNGYLSKIDEAIKSMENIRSISVECESNDGESTFVKEKYEYDMKTKSFRSKHEAQDQGSDVTNEMLHEYYSIDCGDGVLEFQLNLK